MILPIDPLSAAALIVLAASSTDLCAPPINAKINVVPQTEEVNFDYSKTHAQVQAAKIDTINPYGYGAMTHTNGYMQGEITTELSVKLDYRPFKGNPGFYCLWYDEVELTIDISPTIVIPKEVAADRCMHGAVKTHEMKHVMVDRKIVNKYAGRLGKTLYNGLKQRGFSVGPVPVGNVEATMKRMRETAGQLLEIEYKKMEIERHERQQAVDSLSEYESVQAACE